MASDESLLNLFAEALDRKDPLERAAFLDRACGTNLELRQRIEKLLRADEEARGFLSHPSEKPAGSDPALAEMAGDRIGRYKLLQQIGEGGCGVVYMAEQEEPVRRKVALKIIKLGMDTRQVVARFEAERQALALMEHPNIAQVLDAGASESGRPFFVMELVRGVRITEFCDQKKLSTRERLELFMQLCSAVQHAHQKGIIHRDLKPSNLLVTTVDGAPLPKVIDFGIAKATTNQRLTDKTLFTAFEQFIGTPAYMSPEQAEMSGVDVDTRTDIYSLGVVLYELLTSKTPFDSEALLRSGVDEMRRTILEREPAKPSTRLGALAPEEATTVADARQTNMPLLLKLVRGDLDWIVMKCLAKERNRRYESANDLAADIKRYLGNQPVFARPASHLYHFRKLVRRHRSVSALSAVLLIALAFGALMLWRSERQLRRAFSAEQTSRRDALRAIEGLEAHKANGLLADGSTAEGIALLARRIRDDPKNWADCARLMSALQSRRWAVPLLEPFRPPGLLAAELRANAALLKGSDQCLLALFVGTNLIVRDVEHGTNRHEWPLPFVPKRCRFMDAGQVEITDAEERVWTFDAFGGRMLEQALTPQSKIGTSNVVSFGCGHRMFVIAPDHSVTVQDGLSGRSKTLVTAPLASPVPGWQQLPRWNPLNGGRKMIFSDGERVVRVVDCDTGELVGPAFTASDRVEGILISPDERVAVILNIDGSQFWDLEAGRELPGPREVGVYLTVGSFRPSGSQYIAAGNPFGLVLFDPLTGQTSKLPSRGELAEGYCTPDEEGRLTAVTFPRCVAVFDAATGQALCEPLGHIDGWDKGALRFVHDRFATRDAEGLTVLWGVKTNCAEPLVLRHKDSVVLAHFSSDGQRVVTASHDGTAQVWDARTGQHCGAPLEHSKKVWSACFSPDGRRVATASWDASARLWDAASGTPLSPPLLADSYVFHVEFSPDGERLVACGEDGVVRLYDGRSGNPVWTLPREECPIYWAHFSPDGRTLVTRPHTANPILWDVQTGHKLHELTEPPDRRAAQGIITRGDFSRDGEWLALGSSENYATIWHLPEGRLHAVLNQAAVVRAALFSPDAHVVLTAADDLTARLWDAQTGKPVATPLVSQHRPGARVESGQALRGAAIHPDGRRAATGGSDAAVRMWDLRNGLSLGEPADFGGAIMHTEFSPDGQRLLVACFDGTAHILPLPPLLDRAPEWLAPLAEALVFQRFDAQGATEIVSPVALWETCEAIRHGRKDDPGIRWALDLLDL